MRLDETIWDMMNPGIRDLVIPSGDSVNGWRCALARELIVLVEEAPEGGFIARALGESIFTEADDLETLKRQVRDAVRCHFDEAHLPQMIRLHVVRDEVIAV